jgi:hypothetical protein
VTIRAAGGRLVVFHEADILRQNGFEFVVASPAKFIRTSLLLKPSQGNGGYQSSASFLWFSDQKMFLIADKP